MIIRTITCHHAYNHGAMLQAFALVEHLRSMGHDAAVIDYWPYYMPRDKVNFNWVPQRYDYWGVRSLYKWLKKPYRQLEQARHDCLDSFFNQYIPVTEREYNSIDQLRQNPPVADLYIAGSDQIWNTTFPNGSDLAFYLSFGAPKRKVSYAASFATSALKEGSQDFVKAQLKNFDAISVREQSGLAILESLGYKGTVVVDPVFLLNSSQWDAMTENDLDGNEDYILAYDFEKRNSSVGPVAKRLTSLFGCKIYSVSPFRHHYANKHFVAVSPDKFVSLIKHARCVVSNSFHGTAFSMIYKRDFFVVNRKDGLNVRMRDLLNHYDLSDRLVSIDANDEMLQRGINYEQVNQQLKRDIDSSKSFLLNQIELANV